MSKRDRSGALAIAQAMLSSPNPDPDDRTDEEIREDLELSVTALFERLHGDGINVSSLSESDLRQLLRQAGMDEAGVLVALEEAASWSCSDDI